MVANPTRYAVRALGLASASVIWLAPAPARAQAAPPAGHADDAFDVMNLLAEHGLHDVRDERFNAYGQFTYVSSWKRPFSAAYTNAGGSTGSLSTAPERSFSGTFTLFVGAKLWPGGEAYLVPEVIAERPLSGLRGLGGAVQNFELQKGGSETPQLYRSRAFLRQSIGFGGARVEKPSDPMQVATVVDSRRVVLTLGNFTILDTFDRNSVAWDPRQTFLNMAFMTYAAWDFASDARGYSWGAVAELFFDEWAVRLGRIAPPERPNQLEIDARFWKYHGDQLELEHAHEIAGQRGVVRVLGYRNRVEAGRFDDAIAAFVADRAKNAAACGGFHYDSTNASAPDLCWARQPTTKVGVGVSFEQRLGDALGLFFRGMVSDGRSEVYAYTSADRSASLGAVVQGALWRRRFDLAGAGFAAAWISPEHADYLRRGGIDGFIGDGDLRVGAETVAEVFYSANLLRAIWLTPDYQRITNPAFNRDRGPVDVFGARIHAEF